MKQLRKIRNSQARRFEPSSNRAAPASARAYVSWTRSSASLVLPFGTFLVQACYGTDTSNGDTPGAPPAVSGGNAVYTSNIDGGHSHTFSIALAVFSAPADTQGQTSIDEGHAHSVAIAAADLQN